MEEGGAEVRTKGEIRKLRGVLKGTRALQDLIAERARDCAKEDATMAGSSPRRRAEEAAKTATSDPNGREAV